jgi:hypothetical protein
MSCPGRLRERTVLPPAGHASVHETRVAPAAHVGPEPQSLRHPGSKTLDQHVTAIREPQQHIHAHGLFQVERHAAATAERGVRSIVVPLAARALDADHLRAHVGEHHAGIGSRADARDFDHADARERAGAGCLLLQLRHRPTCLPAISSARDSARMPAP